MKIEDQVVSLELSKRLKEMGVKQDECIFRWKHWKLQNFHELQPGYAGTDDLTAAFTVAELGEMLPGIIEVGLFKGQAKMVLVSGLTLGNEWRVEYRNEKLCPPIASVSETEADARAKMLIHLLEKGIVKPLEGV